MIRQTAIQFKSGKLALEGVLSTPADLPRPAPALVMCHPHPTLGGNMDNPVVTAVCRAAAEQGIAALRFNFRGVENSEGSFTNGDREPDDIKAALNLMRRWPGIDRNRIALAGCSFGAGVILRGLPRCRPAKAFALIAPPLSALTNSPINHDKRPKLFIVGSRDRITQSLALQRALDHTRPPVQFHEIPNADHSLRNHERPAAAITAQFVAQTLTRR